MSWKHLVHGGMVLCVAGLACAGAAGPTSDARAQNASPPAPVAPDVGSYDVGLMLGRQLYQNGLNEKAQWDSLVRGLKEGLAGTAASDEQRAQANLFIKAGRESVIDRNQKQARAFLEKNAKAAGVRSTGSGLQYRVIAEGDPGAQRPRPNDQVTVQYRAALADGVEFDSSYSHGRAPTLSMTSIIKGWREALLMMRPGARWQLFVPPELAYGSSPPPTIPPGALLIYDLELVKIEAPGSTAAKPGESARVPAAPNSPRLP